MKLDERAWKKGIRAYGRGRTVIEVAELLGVTRSAIYVGFLARGVVLRPALRGRRFRDLTGETFGPYLVIRGTGDTVLVCCSYCSRAHESTRDGLANAHLRGGCRSCRAERCRELVPCSRCGSEVERPMNVSSPAACDACRKKKASAGRARRRVASRGRVCRSCSRTDAERPFPLVEECEACNRAALRNGRCDCGRAIRYPLSALAPSSLPCPCGRAHPRDVSGRREASIARLRAERESG